MAASPGNPATDPVDPVTDDLVEAEPEPEPGPEVETRQCVLIHSQHGLRLDKALVALAPEFSRSWLQQLIVRGHVRLDGQVQTTASRKLRARQLLQVALVPTAESLAFRPEPMALAALYEDDALLVIDKPAGLVVHPAAGHWHGTLMNGLLAWHANAATLPRAGIVHRLDKDTSGLMVVAKTLPAATALVRAIAAREVKREYLALVHGVWPAGRLRVDAPVGRDPASRVRMAVVASGKAAQTDFERVAQRTVGGDGSDGGTASATFSALRCTLQTGRTHQIRVHAASRGHPLVADALYGGVPALGLHRQALHARRLAFAHPGHGRSMAFEATPPEDFDTAWRFVCDADAESVL